MAHQQLRHRPVGCDDIDHARRQSDIFAGLGDQVAHAGGFRRHLDDHRAAGEQRRGDLDRRQIGRAVPRDDRGDHADRFMDDQTDTARSAGLVVFDEFEPPGQIGIPAVIVAHRFGHAQSVSIDDAGLAAPDRRAAFGHPVDLRTQRPQIPGALGVAQPWPRAMIERPAGGGHGALDVSLLRLGNRGEQLLRAGVDHLEGRGCRRGDPLAADEKLVGIIDGTLQGHRCLEFYFVLKENADMRNRRLHIAHAVRRFDLASDTTVSAVWRSKINGPPQLPQTRLRWRNAGR